MSFYGLSPEAEKASERSAGRTAYYRQLYADQLEKMRPGPRLDGHLIIVPSEWYQPEAATFWKSQGFYWTSGQWQRDVRRRASNGAIYTPAAWLTAARNKFFQFWPGLMKTCSACGAKFTPASQYELQCSECRKGEIQ